ncbi:MAG: hypothetical protein LC792_07125, partial [Actinobacteria bacterium]|nr:hypothetical protein [Actinomycetota bacterium]
QRVQKGPTGNLRRCELGAGGERDHAVLKTKREENVGSPGDVAGAGGAQGDDDPATLAALQAEEAAMVKAGTEGATCPDT